MKQTTRERLQKEYDCLRAWLDFYKGDDRRGKTPSGKIINYPQYNNCRSQIDEIRSKLWKT